MSFILFMTIELECDASSDSSIHMSDIEKDKNAGDVNNTDKLKTKAIKSIIKQNELKRFGKKITKQLQMNQKF